MSEEKPKGGPTEQQIREAIAANLKVDLAPGDVGAAAEAVMALYARYVHWLETDCDPQGTIRENFHLRAENKALRAECAALTAAKG